MKPPVVNLKPEDMPKSWYNILPDLPRPLDPPINPATKQPISPSDLEAIFPKSLIQQEVSDQRYIPIPEEVIQAYYAIGRPTPLRRATRLENYLKTPVRIYFKCEYVNVVGSHKPNTAIAQAYFNMVEGTKGLTTETGAGQWGSALALGCAFFKMKCKIFMTRSSYLAKPYRKILMQLFGAEVYPSPSDQTEFGKKMLEQDPNHPGSLGIAISEAIETAVKTGMKYSLGSVLNHVLLHQTIVGQEAMMQMEMLDEKPDYVVGCIGGGSNYAGLAYPFMREKLKGKLDAEFIAVEPKAVPSITRGKYMYDFGDAAELTPMLKMYTVGHKFFTPPIHAGGLRYHGKAPSLCLLANEGYVKAVAYHQREIFEAGKIFAENEGLVPAPETNHAIKTVIDIALECKKRNEEKVILLNMSGHGLLDLQSYAEYLEGKMVDYELPQILV
ncbi:MAG: TrpB-like pyridoxal phosphate-dependent enzyme [Thermoproteota archaeon]